MVAGGARYGGGGRGAVRRCWIVGAGDVGDGMLSRSSGGPWRRDNGPELRTRHARYRACSSGRAVCTSGTRGVLGAVRQRQSTDPVGRSGWAAGRGAGKRCGASPQRPGQLQAGRVRGGRPGGDEAGHGGPGSIDAPLRIRVALSLTSSGPLSFKDTGFIIPYLGDLAAYRPR